MYFVYFDSSLMKLKKKKINIAFLTLLVSVRKLKQKVKIITDKGLNSYYSVVIIYMTSLLTITALCQHRKILDGYS